MLSNMQLRKKSDQHSLGVPRMQNKACDILSLFKEAGDTAQKIK